MAKSNVLLPLLLNYSSFTPHFSSCIRCSTETKQSEERRLFNTLGSCTTFPSNFSLCLLEITLKQQLWCRSKWRLCISLGTIRSPVFLLCFCRFLKIFAELQSMTFLLKHKGLMFTAILRTSMLYIVICTNYFTL